MRPLSRGEIEEANRKLKIKRANRKLIIKRAPGPDGIHPEIVKVLVNANLDLYRTVLNKYWLNGSFPECWKRATLVLIEKAKKEEQSEKKSDPYVYLIQWEN